MDKKTALKFANQIKDILNENYELVFPVLHWHSNNFINAINSNRNYKKIYSDIVYQVNKEYVYLKRDLGYPSKNIFNIFIRLRTKDKLDTIVTLLYFILFGSIFILAIFFNYLLNGINLLVIFQIYLISFLFLVFLSYLVSKIKS